MNAASEVKAIVVGAGPTGLAMAAGLIRHGVSCRILDRNPGPARESRAIAIHARTLEVFAAMGVADAVLEAGHRIHGANLYAEGHRILHFSLDELASPYPFSIDLPQSETERILCAHLSATGIEVERGVEVTGVDQDASGVTLHTRDSSLRAEYAIGCDGAHSTVRHALGLPFEGESRGEHFILADVPFEWEGAGDEWHLWFHEDGLFTLFPLGRGMYRIIADVHQSVESLDAAHIQAIVEQRGPKHAQVGAPTWMSAFQITQRKVSRYQSGRVFVAGDAAHVHSPAGGQGMNTGIQDAHNLAWKLAMVLRGKAPEPLLESYTAEREPVARSVLSLTENMTAIATMRHPVWQKIRNRVIPILAGFEVFESRLVERIAELGINYRTSPIAGQSGRWYTALPLPGDRAHDAPLGDGRHLFDLMQGGGHVVLLFTASYPQAVDLRGFAAIERYMRQGYPGEMDVHLIAREDIAWEGSRIVDASGSVHHAYAAGVPCVYLIRPDGYVGFRSLTSDPLPLLEHLNRVYEPPMDGAILL